MVNRGSGVKVKEILITFALFVYVCICALYKDGNPYLLHWLGIVIFFYGIYTWKVKTDSSWFSPYTILFLFFVLFNYGMPIMWAFNIHRGSEIGTHEMYYYSRYIPSQSDLIEVQWYVCLAMLLFHFGALLFAKRNSGTKEPAREIGPVTDYSTIENAMRTVGGLVLCVMAPIAIYSKLQEVIIAQSYGYQALYYGAYSTQSGYTQILMYLFFPSLVCYLIGNRYSKKSRFIAYSIFGLYALLGILSGDRGNWLYSLMILIWLHTHYIKMPMRTYVFLVAAGIIGIYLLHAITAVRNTGLNELSMDMFLEVFSAEESPIVDAFFEMGGTMGIITYFLHFGNGIYPYENTYLVAILGALSSRVLTFFGLKPILISNWFSQTHLGLDDYGTGFSMLGEAFVNGGYYGGLVYMFVWGIILGKLVQAAPRNDKHASPIRLFVATASLNVVVGFARNPSYLVVKELLYGVLFMFVLIYIFSGKFKKDFYSIKG
ncbi:MAG: O-antigen polysaccharide polymerase Wzy [Ruminococcaceae bacterium]|nr:O-antigen polysaccharide polymerase Wzy [Oscillospiraceae bacterium]